MEILILQGIVKTLVGSAILFFIFTIGYAVYVIAGDVKKRDFETLKFMGYTALVFVGLYMVGDIVIKLLGGF